MTAHLWDASHPYYCNQTNRFVAPARDNGQHVEHSSWEEFMAAHGSSDPDMNLLFRWDWCVPDPDDYDTGWGEKVPDHDELQLFYLLQRKGDFWSHSIPVTKKDEPAVRAWLTERAKTITALWEPLDLGGDTAARQVAAVRSLAARLRARDEIETDEVADMIERALRSAADDTPPRT